MASPVLLCTDGSELSVAALADGLAVAQSGHPVGLVTAMEGLDHAAVLGSGHAGPVMTESEAEQAHLAAVDQADALLARVAAELDLPDAARHRIEGAPGPAICDLASELGAAAIVIGSRGRGGLRRMVLGSVSDHVVRNAPCPVIVVPARATEDPAT